MILYQIKLIGDKISDIEAGVAAGVKTNNFKNYQKILVSFTNHLYVLVREKLFINQW